MAKGIIFILLILIFNKKCLAEEIECPRGCKCAPDAVQPSMKLVVCDFSEEMMPPLTMEAVYGEFSSIRSLLINCDENVRLPDKLLKSLSSLQNLRIERCETTHISVKMFEDLVSLRNLEMSKLSNPSTSFDLTEESLLPLKKLEKFSLTETPNAEITDRLLCSLPNLQVLNLSMNTIPTLRREESCMAQQLLIVDVSKNHIENLEQFLRGVPAVRQLSIGFNKIKKLSFEGLTPYLQQLDAEGNEIEMIENMLPETVVHLNVASNRLEEIPQAIYGLKHLIALNISRNLVESTNSSEFESADLESLDVSHNNLDSIPSLWLTNSETNIAHIKLDNNIINTIVNGQFSNATNLQTLDLSSNRIRVFSDNIVPKNAKLTILKLANNSMNKLEQKSLEGLKLDQLDLSNNELTEVPQAIEMMGQVKKLDLSKNSIKKLNQNVFNKIVQLSQIDLSQNQLQSIGPKVFTDGAELNTIDLSDNEISIIFKESFARCPKLRRIDLKDNRLKSIDEGLIEATQLKKLDISNNQIVILKWDALPENLEHLIANNNVINLLTAAPKKSQLKSVTLTGNLLNMLTPEQIPNSIETFDVSRNQIAHIAKKTLAAKTQLRRFDVSHNRIEMLTMEAIEITEGVHPVKLALEENPLECSCQMAWILNSNDVKKQHRVIIENRENVTCRHVIDGRLIGLENLSRKDMLCQYLQVCEPECICCQYGNCDCKSVCPSSCRCFRDDNFEINIVRCENNETITPKREFVVSELPVSATEIYLSGVILPQLRTHSFIGRSRLQRLHINGTGLRSIQSKAFNTLPSLRTLDLSDNALISLNGDEFLKTPEVAQLFLNGNRFSTLTRGIFDRLPNLKFLTLHNNSFEDIPPVLSNIISLNGLSLSGNPLRCDCSASSSGLGAQYHHKMYGQRHHIIEHNTIEWMSTNRHLVVDIAKVECYENVTRAFMTNDTTVLSAYPPNLRHDVFVMPIEEFLRDYNVSICVPFSSGFFGQDPQNSIIFVALAVALSILLCVVVILGISFVRKSHDAINQRRYKASSLNCSTSAGSSPLPIPLLSYHAFVSYSKRDEKMVIDQLCRPLEDEDYQLCLLHRDGPSYNSNLHAISDELIGQMESSQCLILVLTRNFLENEWKTLQVKTSHQLFAKNRAKRVIAVLGDGVDANLLDDELGQILRKHTRIEMKSHLFWTLLHSSLPSRIPLNHHASCTNDDSSQVYSDIYGIVPSDVV